MQRLSNHGYALFGTIRTLRDSIALVELEPAFQELLLVWYLWYTCLRDLERRFGGSEAIRPEF